MNIKRTYETFLEATGDQRTAALLTVAAAIQDSGTRTDDRLTDLRDEVAGTLAAGTLAASTAQRGDRGDDNAVPLEKLL